MAVRYQKIVKQDLEIGYGSVTDIVNPGGGLMVGDKLNLNVFSQLDNVHYVMGYGAVGNGAADDADPIQDAALAAKGGMLYFTGSPGTVYLVSKSIVIPSGTWVIGQHGVTIKRKANSLLNTVPYSNFNNVFTVGVEPGTAYDPTAMAEWVVFWGLDIDGNCQNQLGYTLPSSAKGGWGIDLNSVYNAVIRDCRVRYCFSGGVQTNWVSGLDLDNVESAYNAIQSNFGGGLTPGVGTGNGFDLGGNTDNTNLDQRNYVAVRGCKAHHNADEGFVAMSSSKISFSDCKSYKNGNSSYSANSVFGFEFTGADVAGSDFISDLQISNCIAVDNVRPGGAIASAGIAYTGYGDAQNIQIENFITRGHNGYGVVVSFVHAGAVGHVQLSNIIVDGFGTAGSPNHAGVAIQAQGSATVQDVQLTNIQVSGGSSSNASVYISALGGSEIKRLSCTNVHVSNGPAAGILTYGKISSQTFLNCKPYKSQSSGLQVRPADQVIDCVEVIGGQYNENGQSGSGSGILLNYPPDTTSDITTAIIDGVQAILNPVGLNVVGRTTNPVAYCKLDSISDISGNTVVDISGIKYAVRDYPATVVSKTSDYVMTDYDSTVLVDATGAVDVSITLPLAANNKGKVVTIVKTDALYSGSHGRVLFFRQGSDVMHDEMFASATSLLLYVQNQKVRLKSDGVSGWWIIGEFKYFASSAPIAGTWLLGAKMWNYNPSEAGAGGSKYVITGWICTSAGSPGTWLDMRTLTGN